MYVRLACLFTLSEMKCQATSLIEGYLEIQYAFIKVSGNNDQRKFSRSFSVNAPLRWPLSNISVVFLAPTFFIVQNLEAVSVMVSCVHTTDDGWMFD